MKKHLIFTDQGFKKARWFFGIGLVVILIIPWLKQLKLSYLLDSLYFLIFGDWLAEWFQRRNLNFVFSIILGYILAFVVTVIVMFYTAWVCGG